MKKYRHMKRRPHSRFPIKRIKKERNLSPTRWSRRVRHLPPASVQSMHTFSKNVDTIKNEKLDTKSTMTIQNRKARLVDTTSKVDVSQQFRGRLRRLKYPQSAKNSKELISILSAPKMLKKKNPRRSPQEIEVSIRGSSCKSKMVLRNHTKSTKPIYTISKTIKIRKNSCTNGKTLEKRKHFVLEVLNRGDVKDISKLHFRGVKNVEFDRNVEFKVPERPIKKNKIKPRISNNISPIETQEPRRSVRLSLKRARNEESLNTTNDISLECSLTVKNKRRNKKTEDKLALYETNFADTESGSEESFRDVSGTYQHKIKRRSVRIIKKTKIYSPISTKNGTNRKKIVDKTPRIKKIKQSSPKDSPFTAHSKEVLHILNKGTLKEITKLHSIGVKTAEQVLLFRQLRGKFKRIEDMSQMPGWSGKIFEKFLSSNFLRKHV